MKGIKCPHLNLALELADVESHGMEVADGRIIQEALAKAVGHSWRFHLGHANRAIRLLSMGNHWQSAEALLATLLPWSFQISDVSLNAAISGLWWPRALWLLQKLRHDFAPKDAIGSNAATARLAPTAWPWSRRLLCQLQLDALQPTKISFNTAITAAAKRVAMETTTDSTTVTTWRQAMDLWRSMGEAEETISRNGVLSSLGGRWILASQLLTSTPMARLRASIITYNSTINVYEKAAVWRAAFQLIGNILDHQLKLDLFSSNGSLKATHHWRHKLHCLAWMRCCQLQPDQVSLSAAITKNWRQSLKLLHPESPLPRPNEVSLSAAISACEKWAQWSSAFVLMARLPTMTLKANTTSCNALLSACEKGFNWTQAMAVLHQMHVLRVASSETTWNAMASACEKCAQWQLALQTLPSAPGGSEPMAFNAAMVACTKGEASSWRRVLYLLASLPSATVISYDSALASLVARWPMALETIRQMQNDCGCTTWSYEMVLNAMTSVKSAQQLLAEVSEEVTLELLDDLTSKKRLDKNH